MGSPKVSLPTLMTLLCSQEIEEINNKLLMSRPVSDKYLVDLLLGTDFAYTGDD